MTWTNEELAVFMLWASEHHRAELNYSAEQRCIEIARRLRACKCQSVTEVQDALKHTVGDFWSSM